MIDVSIVSHGHGQMVDSLICQLLLFPDISKVILTQNIPEHTDHSDNPRVHILKNQNPKGFGYNHNWAVHRVESPFFCVLNPDIKFSIDPFPDLLRSIKETNANLIAPMVINPKGNVEDSVRVFPGVLSLFSKLIGKDTSLYDFDGSSAAFNPDWVAGMFMLFDTNSFHKVGGFDEGFFLYYEDVDLCARLWTSGMKIVFEPRVSILHNAQRSSRREFRYMLWHASSMLRFFIKHWGRLPRVGSN